MNPVIVFVVSFLLWASKGIYIGTLVERFKGRFNEITAYWLITSLFNVLLAVLVTLLCPDVYFVSWSFPVREFLIFFALSVLAVIPGLKELWRFIEPKTGEEQKAAEPFRNLGLIEASVLRIISSALPEELVFRYIFLGLLSLWDPFAGLIAVSMFFGLGHRFSHRERGLGLLISNVLSGIVFGLAYLYTGSLLVVMVIHWLGNMIPWAMMKYPGVRNVIAAATAFPLASLFVFRSEVRRILEYFAGIYTVSGLFWGLIIGLAMLGVIYAGIKILSAKNGE
ncbi:hypothetical protein A3L10_00145 [Thermococcus radiotolerans]|uniref:CAAX prenyl protease 2/Lysostaphin resistance protein A-like domain-containing protein n=1 Tax=Thermococcus radiotolerans TaxID=187880 RepID=A0A2Z2MZ61_9EURY|nr:hypothetical protein A3L10_00145 [Thermococcus radiotolerans]